MKIFRQDWREYTQIPQYTRAYNFTKREAGVTFEHISTIVTTDKGNIATEEAQVK